MKLSALQVAAITKPGRHSDGRNLFLNVTPTGAKSWLFMWKANGRRTEMGLGSATGAGSAFALSLKQARLKADEVRLQLSMGINPLVDKRRAAMATATFGQLMEAKIAALKADWKVSADGTCANEIEWRASLTKHAATLLPMQVGKITVEHVYSVLKPIWPTIKVTAERVRYRIEQVLELAKAKGLRDGMDNAAAYKGYLAEHLGKKAGAKNKTSHAALAYVKVPAFMQRLLTHKGHAARALAFLTLTAVRTDEARLMKRSEVDFVTGLWTIPAERMKAGVSHIVPLSTAALAILASMPEIIGNDFMFPGAKAGAPLGATALSDKLEEMGFKGEATVHGMRSSFRDWCGDKLKGFKDSDFEACLAHGLDATEGAYRRSTAVETRGEIMQAWANYCEGVSAEVTPIRRAA